MNKKGKDLQGNEAVQETDNGVRQEDKNAFLKNTYFFDVKKWN